ncbi:MAG: T9SS type A sorting domain-containing protein, partial [Ignavibacteriae bacterium]|nr:T9SS type A sorting domain-containing protein [Ignavibacteriota bacterium]
DVFQRPIFALATGPAPAYTLYALNGEAVLRSEDGGDTWSTPYGDGPESPTSIAINSFGHLFVISNYTELWRSLDEGTTWTLIGEIGENSDMASGIISMTFNAKGQLFVADENKQVFGSNDNGTTWHKMVNGLDVKDLLVLSKGNDSSLLAGVYYGVWKTDEPVPKPTGCFDILAQPAECVAWWSGDNNMLDLGYNEHDLTGGVAYNPTGKFGQSFHFDGMGQYLYINDPVDGDLDFVSSNNALTISVWIKQPSVSNYKCIVAKENYNGSGNHVGYRFSTNGGTLLFEIGDGTTSSGVLFSSNNSPMIVDTWYQVAVVFSGVNKPTFYINGSAYPAFQNSTPPSGSVDTDQPLYIGNSLYAFGSFFNGDIDEIVIFNRQLSTVELGQLASNGNGICKPSTLSARTLNLIQPNLPDITWFIGTTRTIQWSSSCVGKINLEYSADNGSTWQPIANEIDASLGEYPWTIPSVTTSLARLKISSSTQPAVVYDISDFTFTIRDQWALIAELNQPTVQWTDASFVTKDIGWIVGTKGNMSKTVDGGKTWTSLIHPQSRNFTGISSINTSSVVAIGNNDNSNNETFHIRTSNGGQSWWINQNAFAPYKMYDISYSNFATGWWVGRKTDENKGIIFKVDVNSNISSVKLFTSPTQFTGTHFLKNSTQGWATGDNGKIFKTTDGNNWQELITNVSSTINDISFADTQNGWAVGDNGLILSTNDGGTTWTEIMPHPTSQNLYGISMLNKNLGWTVGGSGTVFKYIGPGLAQKAKSRFSSNFSGGWLPYQTEATKDLFTAAFAGGTVGIILGDSGETIGYQPTFEDSFYVSVSNTLNRGWNIVSIPVQPDDFTTTILFPSALSNAFKFTSSFGYQSSDTMQNKISYWLKDTTENTFNFTGSLILKDTFELGEGWNMIGSISNPIDIATITTDPPGILESNFFKYHQGYLVADSIEPGKGYWIKTNRAGRMMLETPPGGSSTIFSKFTVNGFDRLNRLNIHDNAGYNQALFFGTSPGEKFGASKYEMPPNPPLGIFDARFASQRLVEVYKEGTEDVYSYQILVSSATSPLKISLSTVSNFKGEVSVNGKKLKNGQELVLHVSDETTLRMDVKTTRSVPQAFTLHQNYPNPFNPSSTVAFDLPAALEVSLKIYDLLGREVMTVLDNQQYEAGNHEITFNASSFASGVYFYRMQARGETVNYFDVKKMLLVK